MDVRTFRNDLQTFTTNFRFAAQLRGRREVVVAWPSTQDSSAFTQATLDKARVELQKIFSKHFDGFKMPPPPPDLSGSGYPSLAVTASSREKVVGASLATVREE